MSTIVVVLCCLILTLPAWHNSKPHQPAPLEPFIPWLAILWGFGVTLVTLHLLGGWHYLTRLSIHAQPAPALWQARLLELSARLQVYIPTHLLESTRIEVPTVIGWLRSVILVPPRAMIGLTTAQLELTLAHELMHVRRHDYLLNLLQNVVEVLFFYHPAVWWVSRQVRTEREHCCDDAVVEVFGSALAYARALAVLEGTRSERPQLALAASGGVLMNRVRRLINKPERSSATAGLFGVVMLLLGGVILAACTSGTAGTNASMVRLAGQEVCLRAEVYAGDHVIPAFSTASVNAMRRAARGTELVLAETCDASNLQLAYRMTFNARTLTWQAELQALTTSGEVAWHGSEAAGIRQEGAFQYLTESNAERLLVRFASDWATRH